MMRIIKKSPIFLNRQAFWTACIYLFLLIKTASSFIIPSGAYLKKIKFVQKYSKILDLKKNKNLDYPAYELATVNY
jgi:hypothetical protein